MFVRRVFHLLNPQRAFIFKSFEAKTMSAEFATETKKSGDFIQVINPTCGSVEWVEQDADYDYHQEIARAAYADMLHDHDRNMKYYEALKIAVKLIQGQGQEATVLDIGTGTGLLSMMAVASGANQVYACEAFGPMANCAAKVLQRNKMKDKVTLISKRSTDVLVGSGLDMPKRANILVTEVFDTELIGEGAIGTFNHAHQHLMTEDCIVIPTSAVLYAQVVDCPLVTTWNRLNPIALPNGVMVNFSKKIGDCHGVPSVQDLQLSEIKPHQFVKLSDPIPVFQFDWNNCNGPIPDNDSSLRTFTAKHSGKSTSVFTWWDLVMDPLGKFTISCKPSWAGEVDLAWRDHWMQAAYYHPKPLEIVKGEEYSLQSFHDEFSFWYKVCSSQSPAPPVPKERPICDCGVHTTLSRTRIGMWNDNKRNQKYIQVLQDTLKERKDATVLILSECSHLAFIAAGLGAKKVYALEMTNSSAYMMRDLVTEMKVFSQIEVLGKDFDQLTHADFHNDKVDIVIGDPFFQSSMLPWHNLFFWYSVKQLQFCMSADVKIIPCKGVLKGIAVDFNDLWKIKAPIGKPCNGEWNLKDFDDLIAKSSSRSDNLVDNQPLWEYPGIARSAPFTILEFDLRNEVQDLDNTFCVNTIQQFNGVALWVDWILNDDGLEVSTGPVSDPTIGSLIDWDLNFKQGVYFSLEEQQGSTENSILHCESSFKKINGEVTLNFSRGFTF